MCMKNLSIHVESITEHTGGSRVEFSQTGNVWAKMFDYEPNAQEVAQQAWKRLCKLCERARRTCTGATVVKHRGIHPYRVEATSVTPIHSQGVEPCARAKRGKNR